MLKILMRDKYMTIHTFTAVDAKENNTTHSHDKTIADTNVINIRSARKAQEKAQQELLDYMMWTMKHDMDPHRLYDDPIEAFRDEIKATLSVA